MGCSPWDCYKSDTIERLHFHFSLSCIGEGNGNPFQCSCLENPRDGGAWQAAIYGVAQSRTRLKRLSGSSSRDTKGTFHAKMGTIKDRNGMDQQKEKILRRGGKNTQKNYTKKDLHDSDNHDV